MMFITGFASKMIERFLSGVMTIAAVCTLMGSVQAAEIETRIIGGDASTEGSWPATVAFHSDNQFCGGTLVDRRWVVTGAHCLYDSNNKLIPVDKMRVLAGSVRLDSPDMQQILVTNAFPHPQYSLSGLDYDIALLELATEAEPPATPIGLNPERPAVGTDATVVGWGVTDVTSSTVVTNLREVILPIVSNETCNAPESYNGRITENMLCAGLAEGGVDACFGDSGGPLMVYTDGAWKLTGVVSFGQDCALPDKYGVYMRITAFESWILSYVDGDAIPPVVNPPSSSDGGGGSVTPLLFLLLLSLPFPALIRRKRLG
jgi:secreted trypsin-like serine protease